MTDATWLGTFLRTCAGEPCPTCGGGVLIYAGRPPAVCPTCLRPPPISIPANGREVDPERVVLGEP